VQQLSTLIHSQILKINSKILRVDHPHLHQHPISMHFLNFPRRIQMEQQQHQNQKQRDCLMMRKKKVSSQVKPIHFFLILHPRNETKPNHRPCLMIQQMDLTLANTRSFGNLLCNEFSPTPTLKKEHFLILNFNLFQKKNQIKKNFSPIQNLMAVILRVDTSC